VAISRARMNHTINTNATTSIVGHCPAGWNVSGCLKSPTLENNKSIRSLNHQILYGIGLAKMSAIGIL
jgi:hypothetical protein